MPADLLQDWSVLRLIPLSFAWLVRRVGDKTISRGSIVYLVHQADKGSCGGAAGALHGSPAMVAIRAAKLTERLGSGWEAALPRGPCPRVTEMQEEYHRLLATAKPRQNQAIQAWDGALAEDDLDGP